MILNIGFIPFSRDSSKFLDFRICALAETE